MTPGGIDHSSTGLPYGWLEHRGTTSAPLLGCIRTQEGETADIRHQEDEFSCTHATGDSDAKAVSFDSVIGRKSSRVSRAGEAA